MELRRPSLALVVVLAAAMSVLTACGGSDTPSGTVDQPISVGTAESEVDPSAGGAPASSADTGGGSSAADTAAEGSSAADTAAEGSSAADTAAEGGSSEAAAGDAEAGKAVFASAGCVGCHTLAAAGAAGNVGPNLDEVKPDMATVVKFVTEGASPMPSFKGQLSDEDIQNVAAYVSSVAGQ